MIKINVTEEMIESCKEKAKNIGKLKNSITRGEGNLSGILGEYIVHQHLPNSLWKNTYDYDLIEDGKRIDVKTKRSKYKPLEFYDVAIAETSLHQECDEYIFVTILNDMSEAWIVGGMKHKNYFEKARYMKKGEIDPSNNFTVKANCYNLQIKELEKVCLQ